jgi:hypothetical protein
MVLEKVGAFAYQSIRYDNFRERKLFACADDPPKRLMNEAREAKKAKRAKKTKKTFCLFCPSCPFCFLFSHGAKPPAELFTG